MSESDNSTASIPRVVLLAWLIPGGGYLAIGERVRGITAGISIVLLFLAGIVVGGIRIMDPPGWGEYGYMAQLYERADRRSNEIDYTRVEPASPEQAGKPAASAGGQYDGPALFRQPIAELGEKPWYVGQILCGPMTLAASAISISAARPAAGTATEPWPSSHSRSWEIGALYTSVAGMLNLLVIIDAAHRASHKPAEVPVPA